MQENREL